MTDEVARVDNGGLENEGSSNDGHGFDGRKMTHHCAFVIA